MMLVMGVASPALGQQLQSWYRPVDQTVEDWNAFSVSQRVVDPGNAQFSDRVHLYRSLNPFQLDPFGQPGQNSFVYQGPGYRAWVSNPEYLSLVVDDPQYPEYKFNVSPVKDGAYLSVVSAGVVWDLTLPVSPPTEMDLHPELDARFDARVYGQRIEAIPISQMPTPEPILGYGSPMVIEEGVPAPPRVISPDQQRKRAERARQQQQTTSDSAADDEVVEQPRATEPAGDESDHAATD